MTSRVAVRKLKLRLNKLDSFDYDNIPLPDIVEAVNKAALEWCRRQVHGSNIFKEGDEESKMRVDDLQFLLRTHSLTGKNSFTYFESEDLPEDYLWYKRLSVKCYTKECSNGREIKSTFVEEANVPEYLADKAWEPSFKWEQCFHTLINNKVRVYKTKDFSVRDLDIMYYRKPVKMDIAGYTHENGSLSRDVDLEFKDDVAELIIDSAAAIIAGDIESANQIQINSQRVENNN